MKIVCLATCHNRRPLTLKALTALQHLHIPSMVELQTCIVDDGSSDGTAAAVREGFPSVVVLDGPGNLYWAGGMRFGWSRYVVHQSFDYLLVFNDDITLQEDALDVMLETVQLAEGRGCRKVAVAGALADSKTGRTTYGGLKRASSWHPLRFKVVDPTFGDLECDTLNMNFSLLSLSALDAVGFLDSRYRHGKADYDFGLRLSKAGGCVVTTPTFVGTCDRNTVESTSISPGLSFSERWRRLTSLKEQPPSERAAYFRMHGGWLWPMLWAMPYLRACLESLWSWSVDGCRYRRSSRE